MRVCHLAKWVVASFLLSILVACGGGSSSTGCASGGNDCDAGSKIDGMGTDGPLVDAIVRVVRFQEWLDGVGDSVLKTATRSDAAGFASGIELAQGAGSGPFLLQFRADGTTTDLTTGVAPAVNLVYTIVSAADFAQNPRPRFYATALTTLAIERAKVLAGSSNAALVEAQLATASVDVLNTFGFGLANTTDIFHTPPILDESVTTLAGQLTTAAYRTALETFAEVVEQAVAAQGTTKQAIFDAIVADFAADGFIGDGTPTADQAAVVTAVNGVTPTYLANSDRFPAADGSTNIEELLDGETVVAEPLAGVLTGVLPQEPDFDGDGFPNSGDNNDYDPLSSVDADNDTIDDAVDNCLGVANTNQLNNDSDAFGDACDIDADGDGANGDGSGGPGVDSNDLDDTVVTDPDSDGIDTNSGLNPSGTATLSGADNCPNNANPLQENYDAGPDGILGTGDDLPNADALGNVCDNDADGDGVDGDGAGGPGLDPDDLDETLFPGETDGDGVGDLVDNCPATPNANQLPATTIAVGGSVPFGIACDSDDDGYPDSAQDTIATGELGEGVNVDNCPAVANGVALDNQADNENDGAGDACDLDDDNDGIPDLADPAPFVAVSDYHFDIFYTQQSSQAGNFKLATISESVLQTAGTTIDTATSNSLDLGTDGLGVGNYDITSDYETVESSIDFSDAAITTCIALAGPSCLQNATATSITAVTLAVSADNLGNTAAYSEPTLTFSSEAPPTALSPWGVGSFVGTGKVTLNGVGSALTTSTEQGLTSLLYTDGTSADADLSGVYGFVDMKIAYASGVSVVNQLVSTQTRVFDASFDGGGVISTIGALSQLDAAVGNADGSVTFNSATPLGVAPDSYSVVASGATTLTFDNETLKGIADAQGELIVLSDGNKRGYGVKLDTAVTTAQLTANTYSLGGLIVQPERGKVLAYDLKGATISFTDVGNTNDGQSITATLNFAGLGSRDSAAFDAEDDALPAVATDTSPTNPGASQEFSMSANGRFSTIGFGLGTGTKPYELEGFFVPGKGLLLRYVESVIESTGGASSSIDFYCGSPAGQTFVDPNTGIALAPQPTGSFVCGFIQVGSAGAGTRFSDLARTNEPAAQVFTVIEGVAGTVLTGDGFGQGIVWGIPQ